MKVGRVEAALALAIGMGVLAGFWVGQQGARRTEPDAAPSVQVPLPEIQSVPELAKANSRGPLAPQVDAVRAVSDSFKRMRLFHPVPASPLQGVGEGSHPQAWSQFAMAAPENPARYPLIAIVIDDLGVAQARTGAALALPAPMTMAVMPYARDAAGIAHTARSLGHEVLVHLPMEARRGEHPGPHALTGAQPAQEFAERLAWNLSRLQGYVGVNNHMGSRLTQNPDAMAMLMAELRRRGLLFLDSRTDPATLAAATARAMGVTTLERDVFLDNVIAPENIRAQLRKVEETARRKGYAIAIGHPHEATIAVLLQWAKDLEARGFLLAPLSAITRLGPPHKQSVSLPPGGG